MILDTLVTGLPPVGQVIWLMVFSFLLIKAADLTIRALDSLSHRLQIRQFALTAFLLAFATTLPELSVSLASAFEGRPNLALGVAIGSNIANLSLVVGGAAALGGAMPVIGEFLKKDLFYTFLAGSLPLLLLLDKHLGIGDGTVLLVVYGWYNYTILRQTENVARVHQQGTVRRMLAFLHEKQTERQLGWLVVGVAAMVASADMVVQAASALAITLLVPPLLVGLILVAVGTSLPELSFGIRAVRQRRVAMVFGNLLGAVVANSTLILGLTAILRPIQLDGGLQSYLVATLAFLVIFNVFWLFVRTKKKLERWEGLLLISIYLGFVLVELWQNRGGLL